MSGPDADAYAKSVVMADFEEAGDDDVFRKVRKDLDDKKATVSDQDIKKTMIDLMAQAIEQIKAGKWKTLSCPALSRASTSCFMTKTGAAYFHDTDDGFFAGRPAARRRNGLHRLVFARFAGDRRDRRA
jgi:hypothetical protein